MSRLLLTVRLVARLLRWPFARALVPQWVALIMAAIFLQKVIHPGLVREAMAIKAPWEATQPALLLGGALLLPFARTARPVLFGEPLALLKRQPVDAWTWSAALAPWACALAAPLALLSWLWPSEVPALQGLTWALAAAPMSLAFAGARGVRGWALALALSLPWGLALWLTRLGPGATLAAALGAAACCAGTLGALALRSFAEVDGVGSSALRLRPRGPLQALVLADLRLIARRIDHAAAGLGFMALLGVVPVAVMGARGRFDGDMLDAAAVLGLALASTPVPELLAQASRWQAARAWPPPPVLRALAGAALGGCLLLPALVMILVARADLAAAPSLVLLVGAGVVGFAWIAAPPATGPQRPVNLGLCAWWGLLCWGAFVLAWWAPLFPLGLAAWGLLRAHEAADRAARSAIGALP
ncbi:MAG: hypothetical protein H6740_23635 [Alphaproteobacteria bacterium]|nr:hypothetical protein [Alphaproteobacteria bacterium]